MNQLFDLTVELYVNQKKSKQEVLNELQRCGLPEETANAILQEVCKRFRKEFIPFILKETLKGIGKGLLFIIAGAIVTGVTYSMASPGGSYLVTTGLFACGGLMLLKSIFYLICQMLKMLRYI